MTDDELEFAFVARLPHALEEAYARFATLLAHVASGALGDSAQGRDCVHDALLRVWLAPDSYRRERGSLRAFLVVCVRNHALGRRRDAARATSIERRAVRRDDAFDAIGEVPDHIEIARLHASLRALPPEQRAVIERAYFGGRSQSEIARELNLPLGTVKSRAALGLRKLTSLFDTTRTMT